MAKRGIDPINWETTKEDAALISKITERAVHDSLIKPINKLDVSMSLTACHLNGCPLKLADLLATDAINFAHDVCGINRHVSRKHFLPRFHGKLPEAA